MTAASPTTRYSTVVTRVGSLVEDFTKQGMLIFFGEGAPDELHDISVLHNPEVKTGGVSVGDIVVLDGHEFPILSVGAVANDNLVNLGHIDLKFNGKSTPPLPGDVCLPKDAAPMLASGSSFRIIAAARTITQETKESS